MNSPPPKPPRPAAAGLTAQICFGLDRPTDERSLALFIDRFAEPALLATLVPRLADVEITATLDFLMQLLKKHLSKQEYHHFFLEEDC